MLAEVKSIDTRDDNPYADEGVIRVGGEFYLHVERGLLEFLVRWRHGWGDNRPLNKVIDEMLRQNFGV